MRLEDKHKLHTQFNLILDPRMFTRRKEKYQREDRTILDPQAIFAIQKVVDIYVGSRVLLSYVTENGNEASLRQDLFRTLPYFGIVPGEISKLTMASTDSKELNIELYYYMGKVHVRWWKGYPVPMDGKPAKKGDIKYPRKAIRQEELLQIIYKILTSQK